jgi:DNA polymerase elongation subunit (family B)
MESLFIPLDYDYFDWQGKNYVRIIGRDDKGKRICVIDEFEPYLWAVLKDKVSQNKIDKLISKIEKIKIKSSSRITNIKKVEIKDKNFLGKDVKALKIFLTNYKDAHDVADKLDFPEIECRRGYDVNLITKYVIDNKMKPLEWYEIEGEYLNGRDDFGGISNIEVDECYRLEKAEKCGKKGLKFVPKVLAFDIEADEFQIGKGEILMISLVGKNFKKVLTWKKSKSKKKYVESYKDEADMLEAFVKYVKEQDPDILVGYFSDGFDMPYLRKRAEKNKVRLSLGLDGRQPTFARGRIPSAKVHGIVHVDIFRFIESVYSQYLTSETLGLDDVSSELLGEKKTDFDVFQAINSKNKDWEKFFEYNLQDSVLTYKLLEKLWPDIQEFSKIIQEPLFEITRSSMSQQVENYILHNLEKYKEIEEKRPHHDEIGARRQREKYEGAFVFQPKAGLYENLAIFDFTSMYGSVIVSHNLSKSTYLEKKEKGALEVDIGKKAYFSKKRGFFPEMLGEVIKKRKEHKQDYKKNPNPITKARSNAYKLLTNAAYGYLGFFGARYYCVEAAASTAALARKHIKEAIEK